MRGNRPSARVVHRQTLHGFSADDFTRDAELQTENASFGCVDRRPGYSAADEGVPAVPDIVALRVALVRKSLRGVPRPERQ